MIKDLFDRRDQYIDDKKRKRAVRMRILIPVCAVCCVALIGFGVWKSGVLRKTTGAKNNTTTPTDILLELEKSQELTAGSSGEPAKTKKMDDTMRAAYETFAYKLFAQLPKGKTRMISPFSIYVALSMLSDGADGNTLAQLDELLGLTAEERNAYLAGWLQELEAVRDKGETTFTNADSVWINEKLKSLVPNDYLNICAQYFKAAVFATPMDDSTVKDVNAWVKSKTKDMIDEIMDRMPPNTAAILMNAITLDAKWDKEFDEEKTKKDYTFTKADGTTEKVDMMFGEMPDGYLQNELATGFIKPYKGGEYSYIALLPREGVSVDQLLASLSPESIRSLLGDKNYKYMKINIGIPKYEAEYSIELNDVLQQLGVTDAFDDTKANLSRMIMDFSVYVGKVGHKTYISVDEKGTQTAGASDVVIQYRSLPPSVILNRPFVYIIVDSNGLPIFLGTFEG